MAITASDSTYRNDLVDFNVDIHDTKDILKIFVPDLDTLKHISIKGRVDGSKSQIDLKFEIPSVKYAGITFQNTSFDLNTNDNKGNYQLLIDNTIVSKKMELAPILIGGVIDGPSIRFNIENNSNNSVVKRVKLDGALSVQDSAWQISFDPSDISLFNDQWYLSKDNYIRFGKGYFETNKFELSSDDRRIILNSEGKQGLALSLTNFNLNFLDNILKFKDIRYSGKIYDFDARIENVFKMEGLEVFLNTDTLFIRDSPYGFITGNFEMASLRDPVKWKVNLVGPDHRMRTLGAFLPKGVKGRMVDELGFVASESFLTQINADHFPFEVLSQFIPGISRLSGNFDTDVKIGGPFKKIGMDGVLNISEGSFQLDYLKSTFQIKDQPIRLSSTRIWADGDTIYDASLANYALVSGGLRHNYFNEWTIDAGIRSVGDNFLILNTTEADNPNYYGQGIGSVAAQFTGSFVRTNIAVQAVAKKDSRLYLPIDSYVDAGEISFIRFVNPNEKKDSSKVKAVNVDYLRGTQFDLDLTITREALVQMIIDRRAGDNVTGQGIGDLSIKYDRTGKLSMYGQYEIEQGEYLFTLLNFFNKPFKVVKGGTINWYGDPYQAQVNLTATYDETTPVAALIQTELDAQGNENIASQARTPTAVRINMQLTGDLFKPNIGFDIDFPNLTGELKSLVDNKLRILRQDQNELNRQVFGIVVVGSFLPDNSAGFIGNGDYFATAFNSVTQVLSGQLSTYLSSLADDWLGGKVSSIDFNVAYNNIRNGTLTNGLSTTGSEVQLQLNSSFIDNRLRVQVGSQIGSNNNLTGTAQESFVGGDILVEFSLTANRQWRLKAYNRLEPGSISGNRQNRAGGGISFNKEYDSFSHMMQGVTDYFDRIRN